MIFVWQISVLLKRDRQSFAVQGVQAWEWELIQWTERSKEKKPHVISTFIVIS